MTLQWRHFQSEFLNRFMTITSAWTAKHNTQRDARTQTHKDKIQQREWGGGSIQKSGLGTRRQTVQEPQTVLYKKGELIAADWSVNWPSSSFFFLKKKKGLSFTRVQRRQNSGTCENEVGSCRGRLQWEQGREVIIQCKITGIQWNEAISGACILSLTALWERYLMIMNGPWNRVDYLRGEIENKKKPR